MKKVRTFDEETDVTHQSTSIDPDQFMMLLGFAAQRAFENEDYAVSIVNGSTPCDCGNPECLNLRPTLLFCFHRVEAPTNEIVHCAFAGLEVIWTPEDECDIPPLQAALAAMRSLNDGTLNGGLGNGLMGMGIRGIPKGIELLKAHGIEGVA